MVYMAVLGPVLQFLCITAVARKDMEADNDLQICIRIADVLWKYTDVYVTFFPLGCLLRS